MNALSQAPIHCIVGGRLVPAAEAVVSVQDRGFRYGDGAFETIAVHRGIPYQFGWHMARLTQGLEAIRIRFDTGILSAYCTQLLKKNAVVEGILRIQVTRGIGSQGYLPDPGHPQAGTNFIIETASPPVLPKEPVSLWLSGYAKISPQALPVNYKLCQGLNSTLARMEAAEHGCFDALLINDKKQLCETSSANLFWLKDDALYTPSLACGVLEGSTRHAAMRLSPWPVEEVEAQLDALAGAEAVFITNAAWGAVAVNRLLPLELRWRSDAATQRIRELLAQDRESYCRMHANPL